MGGNSIKNGLGNWEGEGVSEEERKRKQMKKEAIFTSFS